MVSVTLKSPSFLAPCASAAAGATAPASEVADVWFSPANAWVANSNEKTLKVFTSIDLMLLNVIPFSKFAAKIGIMPLKSVNEAN
jgi:hypothetical protein